MRAAFPWGLGIALLACALGASPVGAQSDPLYPQFSPSAVKGALYRPDTGPPPSTAVLVMHRTGNFLAHTATQELASRGFMVLAMNPRFDNNEAADGGTRLLTVRSFLSANAIRATD